VSEKGLEGLVAKRLSGRYRPGERDWTKVKNRAYWRYEMEREAAIRAARALARRHSGIEQQQNRCA
jgi:ATP-dependent DNA ligase